MASGISVFIACTPPVAQPAKGTTREALMRVETMYGDLQDLRFRVAAAKVYSDSATQKSLSLAADALRERLHERLADLNLDELGSGDLRAVEQIRESHADTLPPQPWIIRRHVIEQVSGGTSTERRRTLQTLLAPAPKQTSLINAAAIVARADFDTTTIEQELVAALTAWRDFARDSMRTPWDWMTPYRQASTRIAPRVSGQLAIPVVERYFSAIGAPLHEQGIDLTLTEDSLHASELVVLQRGAARATAHYPNGAAPLVRGTLSLHTLDDLHTVVRATTRALYSANVDTRPAFASLPQSDAFVEGVTNAVAAFVYNSQWQRSFLGDSVPTEWNVRERAARTSLALARGLLVWRWSRAKDADPDLLWREIAARFLKQESPLSLALLDAEVVQQPAHILEEALGQLLSYEIAAQLPQGRSAKLADWLANRVFRYGQERPAAVLLRDLLGHKPSSAAFQRYLQ